MGFGIARAGQNKDTLPLSTAGLLCGWHCWDTCHGHFAVGHCRGTPRLGTAGKFGAWALKGHVVVSALQGYLALRNCGWAPQGYLVVGHWTLGGWALQGYLMVRSCRGAGIFGVWVLVVGHCKDTWRLGAAVILGGWAAGHCRMLCGWALHGYLAVGHCRDTWRVGTAGMLGSWALQFTAQTSPFLLVRGSPVHTALLSFHEWLKVRVQVRLNSGQSRLCARPCAGSTTARQNGVGISPAQQPIRQQSEAEQRKSKSKDRWRRGRMVGEQNCHAVLQPGWLRRAQHFHCVYGRNIQDRNS